jgi:hypothetical protein
MLIKLSPDIEKICLEKTNVHFRQYNINKFLTLHVTFLSASIFGNGSTQWRSQPWAIGQLPRGKQLI